VNNASSPIPTVDSASNTEASSSDPASSDDGELPNGVKILSEAGNEVTAAVQYEDVPDKAILVGSPASQGVWEAPQRFGRVFKAKNRSRCEICESC